MRWPDPSTALRAGLAWDMARDDQKKCFLVIFLLDFCLKFGIIQTAIEMVDI